MAASSRCSSTGPTNPTLSVHPESSLCDEVVNIEANGLSPGQLVTLKAHVYTENGKYRFESRAHYKADADGKVRVLKDASLGGSYEGIEPMGLFLAIEPVPEVANKYPRLVKWDVTKPFSYTLELIDGDEGQEKVITSTSFERMFSADYVEMIPVKMGEAEGVLFLPKQRGSSDPLPFIIDIRGLLTNLVVDRAATLASHGFAVFAFDYFMPRRLKSQEENVYIDSQAFLDIIDFVKAHPRLDENRIGMTSSCLGSAMMLHAATRLDLPVKCMVAAGFVEVLCARVGWKNLDGSLLEPAGPLESYMESWTDEHKRDWMSFKNKVSQDLVGRLSPFQDAHVCLEENLDCPVLMFAHEDDQYMPSFEGTILVRDRLEKAGKGHLVEFELLPGTGHFLEVPYQAIHTVSSPSLQSPKLFYTYYGGKDKKQGVKDQQFAWRKIVNFFQKHLKSLCRSNRGTVSGYFLAGRYMTWLPVGASLFASNIGSEHFVGLAGSGAAAGIGVAAFELNACLLVQLLGWVFLPVYIASGVSTLPEYMAKRFGGSRIRVYLAMLSLILYIFTKISVDLYSGALFIQEALHWNLYLSIILLLALTAICTVTGGLAAVIYTDTLQFFIMIIGAFVLMIMSFVRIGGYDQLRVKYMNAIPNTTIQNPDTSCGYPREDSFQMLRHPTNSDMPWAGFLFGQTPASIWYWCTDQMMVQRALASKSLSHAQGGCIFAGYIKFLPMFLMVLPGMISRVMFPDEVACSTAETCMAVCGSTTGCSNIAYPRLVMSVLPMGLRGVMLAVMLAALMSDLTSIFNSTSTLFTIDVWTYFRRRFSKKDPGVKELMLVGRLVVLVLVVIAIIWVPIIQEIQGGQLFIYIQEISAYLAPPIASTYLVAILWTRGNEEGCFWALCAGFFVGGIRMILDFAYRAPPCWGDPIYRPSIVAKMHYMYFALFLFWFTILVNVVVSLLTDPQDPRKLIRTTWWTRLSRVEREDELTVTEEEENKGTNKEMEIDDEIRSEERSHVRRAYDWYCGYDDTAKGKELLKEQQERLCKITSLKQDPRAKVFLNINLVLIIGVTTFMYLFYST